MITKLSVYKLVESCIDLEYRLEEGLIKTYALDALMKNLESILQHSAFDYKFSNEDLKKSHVDLTIGLTDQVTIEAFLEIFKNLLLYGYFISSVEMSTKDMIGKRVNYEIFSNQYLNSKWFNIFTKLVLRIEPKWDPIVEINQQFLYHATDAKNVNSILKKGLMLKSKAIRSNHPDRIYLCKNLKDAEFLAKQRYANWNIIKVDISKYENLTFFQDPNYENGIYAYDNFNPNCLTIVV